MNMDISIVMDSEIDTETGKDVDMDTDRQTGTRPNMDNDIAMEMDTDSGHRYGHRIWDKDTYTGNGHGHEQQYVYQKVAMHAIATKYNFSLIIFCGVSVFLPEFLVVFFRNSVEFCMWNYVKLLIPKKFRIPRHYKN